MKYNITVEDSPDGKATRIQFNPRVETIMDTIKRTGRCSKAEEMILIAFEAWAKEVNKQTPTLESRAAKSGIVLAGQGTKVMGA